jgi:type III restriction enzyme
VRVPPEEVRASGLLKDTLDIRHPEEKQPSDATLTMLAADNLRTMSERWADYGREQDEPPVTPVLVVQVRAQESESAIATILNTLTDAWPVLAGRSIGHAFDTHGRPAGRAFDTSPLRISRTTKSFGLSCSRKH